VFVAILHATTEGPEMKLFKTISLLASLCGAALAAETDKPHMVVILVDDKY
jgi:hypothetical protein